MSRPRRIPRAEREREMLAVATRVFAERGYHGASMDEIAERARISKPMLYAYFESKEGLFVGCVRRARVQLFEAINAGADAGAAPDDQLWLGILAFFGFVEEEHGAWAVLLGDAGAGAGAFADERAKVRRDVSRLVGTLLRQAAADEGAEPEALEATEPLARALIGAGESLAAWWFENPGVTREGMARLLMNFAWMGFGELVRGARWQGVRPVPSRERPRPRSAAARSSRSRSRARRSARRAR
jgi:AcrR family transcriptional regulator